MSLIHIKRPGIKLIKETLSQKSSFYFANSILNILKLKNIKNILKLLREKPAVSLPKFIICKIVYVINCIHFFVIIVSYLALIRLLFVQLGFRHIKRKYILYYYTILCIGKRCLKESLEI